MLLEEFKPGLRISGVVPAEAITVIATKWHGPLTVEVTYMRANGALGHRFVHRKDQDGFSVAGSDRPDSVPEFHLYAEPRTVLWRHVNALSWRVLSELARRDNSLYIALTGDGGSAAHAMALMMTDGDRLNYQARRRGLGFAAGSGGSFQIEWVRAFDRQSPRHIAIELEQALGLDLGERSPATSSRALGYRLIAGLLELTLGDSASWDTMEFSSRPFDPKADTRRLRPWEDTAWAITRDGEAKAFIDNFGQLKRSQDARPVSLMELYQRHGRRILPLVAELFGSLVK